MGNEELDDELDNFDLDEANRDWDFESPVEDLEFRCLSLREKADQDTSKKRLDLPPVWSRRLARR